MKYCTDCDYCKDPGEVTVTCTKRWQYVVLEEAEACNEFKKTNSITSESTGSR